MTFEGFPEEALVFYEGLEADNSKAYWEDHKPAYDRSVAGPMRALLAELEALFGEAKLFRPYRDVRFSKDKTPYKTQAAAVVHDGRGALYLALSADGLLLAGGLYSATSDQVQRLRAAVADDLTASTLVGTLAQLEKDGWEIGGEQLKRIPRPWDDTHPRADLLRHKSLTASLRHEPAERLHTAAAKDDVVAAWRALAPLNSWLHDHVGASR